MNAASIAKKAAGYLQGMGLAATAYKLRMRLRTERMYRKARVAPHTAADIARQKKARMDGAGVFLVMADVRGVSEALRVQLADALNAQTYANWRLCLAGGGNLLGVDGARMADAGDEAAYIALLAPGCTLHPCALYDAAKRMGEGADMVYTDETDETGAALYKPDYGAYTLRSINLFGGFAAMRGDLPGAKALCCPLSHEAAVRMAEGAKVAHIPQRLCTRGLPLANADVKREKARVEGEPLVSILIPNKDHGKDLARCIGSLREKTTYKNWEILILENNSVEEETFALYKELEQDARIRVITWDKGFNYAAINNFGEAAARGEYLLLLNNDVEIISPEWLEEMLFYAQQESVGAVGALLWYPDDTVQHAGVIVGVGDVAGHALRGCRKGEAGYLQMLLAARNVSAVTAACLLMKRSVYRQLGGMDEGYAVAYNDVDLCMRIREAGLDIVFTPHAQLYHYESQSRGLDTTAKKYLRYYGEATRFHRRWRAALEQGDPFHNGNLSKRREDFGV